MTRFERRDEMYRISGPIARRHFEIRLYRKCPFVRARPPRAPGLRQHSSAVIIDEAQNDANHQSPTITGIRAGTKKAAGKFSKLKAFAQSIAVKLAAKTRSIMRSNVQAMAAAIFRCSTRIGRL